VAVTSRVGQIVQLASTFELLLGLINPALQCNFKLFDLTISKSKRMAFVILNCYWRVCTGNVYSDTNFQIFL
jgi:hypothetical protein